MTPQERPTDRGVWWFGVKANGCPEMGFVRPGQALPDSAVGWATEGDAEWTRVTTESTPLAGAAAGTASASGCRPPAGQ